MKRTLNIIERAVNDFGLEVDMNDTMQDILDQAMNAIEDAVEYDYISECEVSGGHLSWSDGKGFQLDADGQFMADDREFWSCYRKNDNGEYEKIEWYEAKEGDYVVVYDVIDSDGLRALLVLELDC